MKRSLLLGLISSVLLNTSIVYADYSFRLGEPNACDGIAGTWSGKGEASHWLLGRCVYHATSLVSPVDDRGHFIIQGTVDKESGSFLCPEHSSGELNALCLNGLVTIKTDFGYLDGDFFSNNGTIHGTLSVPPGFEANISAQFFR